MVGYCRAFLVGIMVYRDMGLSGIGTQHVKRTFWNAVRNVLPERVDNYTTQRGQCFLQNVKRENVSCCSERGT